MQPLVGAHIGTRTDPREFADLLVPSRADRELHRIAESFRFRLPAERAPLTGLPPVVDLVGLLKKHSAAGRFAGPERPEPKIGEGSRVDAIAALAAAVLKTVNETGRNTELAARPEASADALVLTRTELPPRVNSVDIRDLRHSIKNFLRKVHPPRTNARKCGRVRYQKHVEARSIRTESGERGAVTGIVRCASVWSCPTCAPAISSTRAEIVRAVIKAHRERIANEAVYMLTLTMPHELAMKLKKTRCAVSEAWQRMQRGKPWQRLRARMGFVGSITAREITVGANGWHPHLHILIATSRAWTEEERYKFEVELFIRWANALEKSKAMRPDCPSWEHGISLVACHDESYIQKLGLADEMTRALHKQARGGNRTPFEVMADYYRGGSPRDEQILREYVRGIKGARQLTWSRGKDGRYDLRQRYAEAIRALDPDDDAQGELAMYSDAELLARAEKKGVVVAELPGKQWDALVRVMKRAGADAEYWISSAVEYGGAHGVEAAKARAYYVGKKLAEKDKGLRRWLRWLEPRDDGGEMRVVHELQRQRVERAALE